MGVLDDIIKFPLKFAEEFFNKGYLSYVIIGLIIVGIIILFRG